MRVPSGAATAELVVKRSRFFSSAHRFDDPALIKETLGNMRGDHPGCNHVVYAFVTGTGGLVRAYSESARAVLSKLDTEELEEKLCFSAAMPYSCYEACRRLVESLAGTITKEDFGTTVSIFGELPAFRREELEVGFADLTGGRVVPDFPEQV